MLSAKTAELNSLNDKLQNLKKEIQRLNEELTHEKMYFKLELLEVSEMNK